MECPLFDCDQTTDESLRRAAMSAFGTKRTFRRAQPMSAFGGKADISVATAFVPATARHAVVARQSYRRNPSFTPKIYVHRRAVQAFDDFPVANARRWNF